MLHFKYQDVMKIKKILNPVFLIALLIIAACSDYKDIEEISPEVPAGNQGVYFPTTNIKAFELEPTDPTQITLKIARTETGSAAEVPIKVEINKDNAFQVPATVSFASGEKEKDIVINFPNAQEGVTYTLKLAVEGDQYVNPYGSTVPYVTTSVTRIKWTPIEEPMIYIDGTFVNIWGAAARPMYVDAEKAELGQVVRYRFKNVYAPATVVPDADGISDGFYNNSPGFHSSQDWYTTIEIADPKGLSGKVTMLSHEIGVEWSSYGMISIGSVKDVFGTLANNVVTFPANSLYFRDNDGAVAAGTPTYIYFTKEAFIAANLKITDFNKVEYDEIEGEIGEFQSAAYKDNWNQTLSKAVDIDEENEASEYKDLYYLPNLYAEGYGVAFYYKEGGRMRIVENQKIGDKVYGQDIYVSQSETIESSVEVNTKGVTIYTLGLMFHFKDGTIVGNFAEKFFYSADAVSYDKADFIGNFVMTGPSQFGGEPDAKMNVKIAEGVEENTFILTGVDYAKEIIVDFDPERSVMSISPQVLADVVTETATYDMTLYTTDAEGVSSTAAIDFTFDMQGKLVITSSSVGDGYLIRSEAAGGWVDGYHSLVFTPSSTKSANISAMKVSVLNAHSDFTLIRENKDDGNNFKIQGKKSPKSLKKDVSVYSIF